MAAATTGTGSGICVFSGGTAANSLVDVFNRLAETKRSSLTYIIPISDNGGSSSELIRVLGGPSVGDIRSRLVRLIPNNGDEERSAVKTLFEYRLPPDPRKAKAEWLDIVEGRHLLWSFVSSTKRELIRSVLNTFNAEIVQRARPTSGFNFAGASVGNLFLTGARLFTSSFESAIYLLSLLCSIPPHVTVLPAINSNFTHHISAGLADGSVVAGQCNISHPSAPTALPDTDVPGAAGGGPPLTERRRAELLIEAHDRIEDATLPGSLPALRRPHLAFSKDDDDDDELPARIERVWYINPYGHEMWPVANPKALAALREATAVVYSIGSLYTSLVPSLVLRGVGETLAAEASSRLRHKVLLLNGRGDRETGPARDAMAAADFVRAVVRAAKESRLDPSPVRDAECARYVTHLVHLVGEGVPIVDVEELGRMGVQCVRLGGRSRAGGGTRRVLLYDEEELARALEGILAS